MMVLASLIVPSCTIARASANGMHVHVHRELSFFTLVAVRCRTQPACEIHMQFFVAEPGCRVERAEMHRRIGEPSRLLFEFAQRADRRILAR